MTEERIKVLIASLGESPGIVTSAVDALKKEGVTINKVITISTQNAKTCQKDRKGNVYIAPGGFVELLKNEFENGENPINYIYDCIGSSDIESKADCEDFLKLAVDYIIKYQKDHNIYICVSGGRKSMAVLLTIAAQFFGFTKVFNIAITDHKEQKYIEDNGSNLLSLNGENRKRILHPESAEIVALPICNLSSFSKTELKGKNNIFDSIFKYCEEIQNRLDRDIPEVDPAKI